MYDCPTAHLGKCLAHFHVKTIYDLVEIDGAADDFHFKYAVSLFDEPFRKYFVFSTDASTPKTAPLSVDEWIEETLRIRRKLILALKKESLYTKSRKDIDAAEEKADQKYQAEIDYVKKMIDYIKSSTPYGPETLKPSISKFRNYVVYSAELNAYEQAYYSSAGYTLRLIQQLAHNRLEFLENMRNKEIEAVDNALTIRYNPEQLKVLADIYPIPSLPDLTALSSKEKLYCLMLSTYSFWTLTTLRSHELISQYAESRIKTSLRRLCKENVVREIAEDGDTYYVPFDIADLFFDRR